MDFRLRAFISVAEHLNFTKAANELHISQPAVSKHIQELETHYGVQLFERLGSRVVLTHGGEIFLTNARQIIDNYRQLGFEMGALSGYVSGPLRIGASTTIAQYILPELVARLLKRHPDICPELISGNSEQIERAVIEHRIDIGFVENIQRQQSLRYTHFQDDELVLICHPHNPKHYKKQSIKLDDLINQPLILRENGSGTLEVIEKAFASHNIRLSSMNILMHMDSTESIKQFIQNYPSCYGIVSASAISNELALKSLKTIEIENTNLIRPLTIITSHGQHNQQSEILINLAQ